MNFIVGIVVTFIAMLFADVIMNGLSRFFFSRPMHELAADAKEPDKLYKLLFLWGGLCVICVFVLFVCYLATNI